MPNENKNNNTALLHQQQDAASLARQTEATMRLLPDFPLFHIQRWLGSPSVKTMPQNHDLESSDAKPKRMNAEANWEMEEFERDLALRFAARDLDLKLERTNGPEQDRIVATADLVLAQQDNQGCATVLVPGGPSTPRMDRPRLKQAFRQRWLKSQASNATIQALSVPCAVPRVSFADNAPEGNASEEELDFDFSDTRPSTPSTPTPPPYPLAHYSSRIRDDDYLEEDTQLLDQPDDDMQLDQEDLNSIPTPASSQSSPVSPSTTIPITPVSVTSDQKRNRHSLTRLFRTSLGSTITTPTTFLSTTTAATENTLSSTTTTSQSMLSLVSHFSSCTSSCGDSDDECPSSSLEEEDAGQVSILQKFRDLTLTRRRGLQLSALQSPTHDDFSETTGYPSLTKHRTRRYSSPDAPPNALSTPAQVPPLPTQPYSPVRPPPIRNKRRSIINDTASRMKMKRKKKRLVVRGIEEGDLEAVEGLGRWASRLGEVRRLTRVQDGTIWIEFRSRKVADNVCRLNARVEIIGVGHVIIDWAESRQAG